MKKEIEELQKKNKVLTDVNKQLWEDIRNDKKKIAKLKRTIKIENEKRNLI